MNSKREGKAAEVMDEALRLFEGDREAALLWLNRPAKALEVTSKYRLDTKEEFQAVRDLIFRIECGVIN